MFVIIVLFFNISYVCIFLPIEERVNKLREKAKRCMNVKGTERKVLTERFCPIFFVTIQRKTVYYPPMSKDSPTLYSQLLGK